MMPRMVVSRAGLLCLLVLFSAGCDTFFSQKPTEIQTNQIIYDLSKVHVVTDPNAPVVQLPNREPVVVTEGDKTTLFYFVRNQSTTVLMDLVTKQYSYLVHENKVANQLVISCDTESQVEGLLVFLAQVDVPPVQVKIDCLISEVFANVAMDYETDIEIKDLISEGLILDSFLPGSSVRFPGRKDFGLETKIERGDIDAVIDILVSRGYAKILMRPSLEVVNGTTARIETIERVPVIDAKTTGGVIAPTTVYHDVMDYLEVTPQVYADGTIGLKTLAGISSRTIPDSSTQAPIITTRNIQSEENRLSRGYSLVIGGIRKTERVSVVRGVPFLKDIPLVGILFSSKDFEDRAKEILFILTPSISAYGQETAKMLDKIEDKHAKPEYENPLGNILKDPFAPKPGEYSLPDKDDFYE